MVDQQMIFAPNESMKCLSFPVQDDSIALEHAERLVFTLAPAANRSQVTVTSPNTTVTILDDDGESDRTDTE